MWMGRRRLLGPRVLLSWPICIDSAGEGLVHFWPILTSRPYANAYANQPNSGGPS